MGVNWAPRDGRTRYDGHCQHQVQEQPKEVSESQGSPTPHIPPFGLSQAFYLLPVFGVASSQEIVPEGDGQTLRANVLGPP